MALWREWIEREGGREREGKRRGGERMEKGGKAKGRGRRRLRGGEGKERGNKERGRGGTKGVEEGE